MTEKSDVWSLGVVLWEIVSGDRPRLRQMRALRCPEECPAAVAAVIDACRCVDPAGRPSARELYEALAAAPGGGRGGGGVGGAPPPADAVVPPPSPAAAAVPGRAGGSPGGGAPPHHAHHAARSPFAGAEALPASPGAATGM